jgi:CCR4-NOT transcription complex subunit 6
MVDLKKTILPWLSTLFSKKNHQQFFISNTHIHANSQINDVKLWQVSWLLWNLKWYVPVNYQVVLVICREFNCLPKSVPYSLLKERNIHNIQQDLLVDAYIV